VTGIVTVGLLESVVAVLAEPLVRALADEHPGVELRLLTAYSGHLQQWLDAGDVDLSLLYNLSPSPSLAVVPLVDEPLWALAPPGSGLDADVPVPCAEVLARRLVLPVPGHGLRVLIDQAVAHLHVQTDVAVQVNSMHLQKLLVRQGHGWSILPAAGVAADVVAGVLDGAPLSEPSFGRQVVVGLPRGGRVPAPVQAVTTVIGRVVRHLVRTGAWPGAVPASAPDVPPV
jgi:DNA-binding transcriptional LysR family regulator